MSLRKSRKRDYQVPQENRKAAKSGRHLEKILQAISAGNFFKLLLVDVEIRVHVLDIVLVFNGFEQTGSSGWLPGLPA